MNDKSEILAEELEWALSSLQRTCENLEEEEFKFKPTTVSNSIQWQLNHISRIVNMSLPRLIKGVTDYTPEGWPEDYREQDYPLDRLLNDIKNGAASVLPMLTELSNDDLEAEIPMWGGTRQRKIGLFAYIGEVYHHKGQVAYIRGTFKRLKE